MHGGGRDDVRLPTDSNGAAATLGFVKRNGVAFDVRPGCKSHRLALLVPARRRRRCHAASGGVPRFQRKGFCSIVPHRTACEAVSFDKLLKVAHGDNRRHGPRPGAST